MRFNELVAHEHYKNRRHNYDFVDKEDFCHGFQ